MSRTSVSSRIDGNNGPGSAVLAVLCFARCRCGCRAGLFRNKVVDRWWSRPISAVVVAVAEERALEVGALSVLDSSSKAAL